MDADTTWLCWQLADSAFPSGGFAHSLGVEAAWAGGLIDSPDALAQATRTILSQQARTALPLIGPTHAEPMRFAQADRLCHAMQTNHIARQAGIAQGRALLRAAIEAFPGPLLRDIDQRVRAGQSPGHIAPVFGAVAHSLRIPVGPAGELFMFQCLRSLVSAAVRLGIVGPLHAQALIRELAPDARRLTAQGLALDPDDMAETAPILSLMQSSQERLYSRLFRS